MTCPAFRHRRLRGRAWLATRARVLRLRPLCIECQRVGRVREAVEVDHRLRLADGGTNDDSNLQGLCLDCHKAKTAAENRSHAAPTFDEHGRVVWTR